MDANAPVIPLMTTQSLRGLKGNGPMHWRGDRTGVSRAANETLEEQAFEDFNVAFTGLLGRASQLSEARWTRSRSSRCG